MKPVFIEIDSNKKIEKVVICQDPEDIESMFTTACKGFGYEPNETDFENGFVEFECGASLYISWAEENVIPQYNHAFTIAFEVISNHPEGEDITSQMFNDALSKRIKTINEGGVDLWNECTDAPFDTYKIDPDPASRPEKTNSTTPP